MNCGRPDCYLQGIHTHNTATDITYKAVQGFSDEDLKRLKKFMNKTGTWPYCVSYEQFKGLLARLSAAERTCKAAECVRDELHWGDERQMALRDILIIELEAWRKSKGE